jgi:hypothetical protein
MSTVPRQGFKKESLVFRKIALEAKLPPHNISFQWLTEFVGGRKRVSNEVRALIEACIEWAWGYFGRMSSDPILDRNEQANINWNDDDVETTGTPDLKSIAHNPSC